MLMDRKFGIRQNLPHEQVFEIKGHACVSLIGILRHTFAHKICTGFSKETDINGSQSNRTRANGCAAMDALLEHTKKQNLGNLPTKYGAFVLWLDGFVKSWIKQKENNVSILTVTFQDADGNATSQFQTFFLAVGKSSKDHQPVLDHYMDEVEILTKEGVDVFCATVEVYKRVQMGLLAYIADRPERHAMLCQLKGEHFGKRTQWPATIDDKHLPYCDKCFWSEVKRVLCDCYCPFGVN